tara:strand:- start:268 stop:393 length:126 start_codon:yes stop_codon:yes gene_type:complete
MVKKIDLEEDEEEVNGLLEEAEQIQKESKEIRSELKRLFFL